jgi:hypothetical protein
LYNSVPFYECVNVDKYLIFYSVERNTTFNNLILQYISTHARNINLIFLSEFKSAEFKSDSISNRVPTNYSILYKNIATSTGIITAV